MKAVIVGVVAVAGLDPVSARADEASGRRRRQRRARLRGSPRQADDGMDPGGAEGHRVRSGAAAARRKAGSQRTVGRRRIEREHRARRRPQGRAAAAAVGEGASRLPQGRGRALPVLHADGRPARQPVSLANRAVVHGERPDPLLHPARERRGRRLPPDLHGRAQASRGSDSNLVRPLDRALGRRHAGDRHGRL